MDYEVVITEKAMSLLDSYVRYIANNLGSLQAAKSVIDDASQTAEELRLVAGSLKYCDNLKLQEFGYKKINFRRHRYLMIFRVEGNTAIVEGIYHQLQDYENLII